MVNTTINFPLDMKVVMYWQSSAPPSMRARQGSLIEILLPIAFQVKGVTVRGVCRLKDEAEVPPAFIFTRRASIFAPDGLFLSLFFLPPFLRARNLTRVYVRLRYTDHLKTIPFDFI